MKRSGAPAPVDLPLLLVSRVGGREVVAAACERSMAAGVSPGMDASNAKALLPRSRAHIAAYRPDKDASALHAMACWMNRYAPVVAPDPPDGLLMDVTGTERLYRGEYRLLRTIASALSWMQIRTRIAAASTFGCAWAVARFGGSVCSSISEGAERETLADLPVGALRVDEATQVNLAEIGVTTVGQVLALPRRSLPSRFGPALLLRVDQALGAALEMIRPVRPQPPPRIDLVFDGPTTQWEAVEQASREALTRMCGELATLQRGIRSAELRLDRISDDPVRIRIMLSRPTREVRHLWSLLRPRLEGAQLGHGVEGVSLTAQGTARLRHEQAGNFGVGGSADEPERAVAELVDTIINRLGADAVARIEPVPSHLPERAFRLRSVMDQPAAGAAPDGPTGHPRPSRIFCPAESAAVIALTPDGPVMSLRWRGRDWRVESSIGPERICPEWWRDRPDAPSRDYFRVSLSGGRWIWLCRESVRGRWLVHGEWS